jgi:hypothetical protein
MLNACRRFGRVNAVALAGVAAVAPRSMLAAIKPAVVVPVRAMNSRRVVFMIVYAV